MAEIRKCWLPCLPRLGSVDESRGRFVKIAKRSVAVFTNTPLLIVADPTLQPVGWVS